MKSLKNKLNKSELTIGSWLSIGNSTVTDIMAGAGFDWLAIDLEHTSITIREAEDMIRIIELAGSTPLVRVTSNNSDIIKRVMDCGAHGVIVPMVNNKCEAEQAVSSMYYPPLGNRGVGLYRAQKYGPGFDEYKSWLPEHGVLVVQIESKEAVENIEDILSVDGVAGALIGPYDLSNSLGVPGELNHPRVEKCEQKLISACNKYGVVPGIHIVHPDQEKLQKRIDEGFRFIAYGVDMIFLGNSARQAINCLKKHKKL